MATCLNSKRFHRLPRMSNSITLVDVMCPVCRGIFIEPVTLPCQHGLCLKCFERSMEESSLACPMCRKRVGGWLRTATKDGNLVNIKLWALIQQRFPDEVQAKMNGDDDGVEERVVSNSTPQVRLSTPGEIGQEFAYQLHQLQKEAERRQEEEWRASCNLIQKLCEEEQREKERQQNQVHHDEQVARELQETMMQSSSNASQSTPEQVPPQQQKASQPQPAPHIQQQRQGPSSEVEVKKGPLDFFFATRSFHKKSVVEINCPSDTPGCSSDQARSSSNLSTGSQDSITQEMLHFKPIKVVPRTPPKRLPGALFADGQVVEPRIVKATPLNLNRAFEVLEAGADVEALLSPASRLRLGLCQPECTLPQPSAFRGYPCIQQARSSSGLEEAEVETPTKRPRLAPAALDTEESSAEATPSSPTTTETDINMGVLRLSPSGPASSSHSADLHTKVGFLQIIPADDPVASSSSSGCYAGTKDTPDSRVSSMDIDNSSPVATKSGPGTAHTSGMDIEEEGEGVENESSDVPGRGRESIALRLLAEEQAAEELRLQQEQQQQQADWELAKRLQDEWDLADQRVDRSRGSDNPYELRRKPTSAGVKANGSSRGKVARGRQRTLEETFTPRRRSGRN
ncbi:hypothetical protein R5R35_000216 [Gryllus longicercus]|uniref:RING-type E3 ubiquitin transferase n=2 Tax=Gryllus longicercus TaxID=2509291 RepID=A0AAN9Z9J5_9ORTH